MKKWKSQIFKGKVQSPLPLNLYCAALYGYILLAPLFNPWADLGGHDTQRIFQLFLLVLAALFVLANRRLTTAVLTTYQTFSPRSLYMLLAALALALLSCMRAPLPEMALLEIAMYVLLVHTALLLATCRISLGNTFDQMTWALLVLFAALCSTLILAALAYIYSGNAPMDMWKLFSFIGFENPRFFGQVQTLTFPVLGALLLNLRKQSQRLALLLLLAFWWALSIAGGTRGTWLAMLVAMCAAMLLGKTGRDWVRWQMAALVAGLAVYGLLFVIPNWHDTSVLVNRMPQITSLSGREIIWQQAWANITAHPWLGIGPMQFALNPNGVGAHPHSAPLQWAAEMGLPFALIFLWLTLSGYLRLYKAASQNDGNKARRAIITGLYLALLAGGVQALVDGIAVMPYSQTMIALLVGWAIGVSATPPALPPAPTSRFTQIGYVLLLLAALFALANGVYPEIFQLADRENSYISTHGGHLLNPRFWRQGWLTW